ncbi:hypothetical protein N9230_05075 [Akkermansiaceae bacterium]|nr:hypothetical protein [Akkermansiaceae bacterium]
MQVEQQNGIPAAEVLSAFFRVIKERGSEASKVSLKELAGLRRAERCFGMGNGRDCVEALVESYHRRVLIGAGMRAHSKLPKDVILFSATLPVHQIAEMACGVACESGRLLEIHETLTQLDESDECTCVRLEEEGEKILNDIFDTVFVHVLRDYGQVDVIKLFEEDREAFELRCQNGGELAISEADEECA